MTKSSRVLVVGVGSIGERHLRCFASIGANVSICDPNESLRTRMESSYAVERSYSELVPALDNGYDAVVVATPAPLHVPQAMQVVRSGSNVLIEKPLSLVADGLTALEDELTRRRLVAGVAYPLRAHPALASLQRAVASGQFGVPLQVTVTAGQNFPTYRPAFRDTYYRSRSSGGGAIQDALTHLINAVEWIVGPTTAVVADAERLVLDGVEVEDTAHVLARNGGVLTTYSLNQHQPANETTITIVCHRGQLRYQSHRFSFSWLDEVDGVWREEVESGLERDTLFQTQARDFLAAVNKQRSPLCPLNDGIATINTVLAILRSLESRCWESTSATPQ